jgi:hypothetical protein
MLVLKILLVLLNVVLLVFLVWQIMIALHIRSRRSSWSTAFHCLAFAWSFIRTVFFAMTIISSVAWNNAVFYILYWLPGPIQFTSFALLILFYAQVLNWK